MYPEAQKQTETQFVKQFTRLQEGIRLSRHVEWDDDEKAFNINGHLLSFDANKGWMCDCQDRMFRGHTWWCKHMIALIYFMGGLPKAQKMVEMVE